MVALIAYAAIAGGVMLGTGDGPDRFIGVGERSSLLDHAREVLGPDVAIPMVDGHDGQRFWVLARDPLLRDGTDTAALLDRPVYRAQRIGYPLVVAPWGLGGEHALVWGLLITNLGVVALGTWFAARFGASGRGSGWAGAAFAASPLVWASVVLDFADAMALAGLLAVLWALRADRAGFASFAAAVACLAKETSALGVLAVAIVGRGLSVRDRITLVAGPLLATVAWRGYVLSRPGFGGETGVRELEVVPFQGFIDAWNIGWQPLGLWSNALVAILLIPLMAMVIAGWWRHRDWASSAALPYAVLLPFLSYHVVGIPANLIRAVGPAITLALIGHLSRPANPPREGSRRAAPILSSDGREAPAGGVHP